MVAAQALRKHGLTLPMTLRVFVSAHNFEEKATRFGIDEGGRIGLGLCSWCVPRLPQSLPLIASDRSGLLAG